ncbi:01fe6e24-3e6a-48cd-a84c-f64e68040adf [Sclerotinia trifoliorum]|uniref:01fe6e24-3e6a-48cd-a84c-f64e68040adf n=1 Tax=Sclerotinia trifoliorum TaxID=28548 RepID=A0A8H2VS98_9HELO|nr:01fe6e24-3e6a-48cd-a84c-f64e68040adf [Sclerotinia trifoliorum]
MKPRGQADETMNPPEENTKAGGKATPNASKKKQPSSTSVAGRKIARKTAHSLIERRRRSKMNEEFGVLKDMIPACTGEMHKLAILQASIDYVKYLEDCVSKLKAENSRGNFSTNTGEFTSRHEYSARESEEDTEMTGSENRSSNYATPIPPSQQTSPAMLAQDFRDRQNSYSSVSTNNRHYSISTSSTTSPALAPSVYDYARSIDSVGSALTSPALMPQRDQRYIDEEASAALLMLNSDRRATNCSGVRGMSVKDLLSS